MKYIPFQGRSSKLLLGLCKLIIFQNFNNFSEIIYSHINFKILSIVPHTASDLFQKV